MPQLKRILLVDDDDDLREALSEQLVMTEDFDVFEAGSGSCAMQKTKEGLFDPGLFGLQFCQFGQGRSGGRILVGKGRGGQRDKREGGDGKTFHIRYFLWLMLHPRCDDPKIEPAFYPENVDYHGTQSTNCSENYPGGQTKTGG